MKVIGIRRDPSQGANGADSIHGMADLVKLVPQADIVALTCALTPETTGLMSAAAFAAMKPSADFVNVARGKVADEAALIATLKTGKICRPPRSTSPPRSRCRRPRRSGPAQRLRHAAHRRRDPRLRGQRASTSWSRISTACGAARRLLRNQVL